MTGLLLEVDQLQLVQGVRQEPAQTVGVFEMRQGLRRRHLETLCVLIDLLGEAPADEALIEHLVQTVVRAYLDGRGSITRRLRDALASVNFELLDLNRSQAGARHVAGVTCAALVGDDVYLAQAGPALAYIAQPGALQRLPKDSPWLSDKPLESMPRGIWTPLGLQEDVVVHLNYCQVAPGYTLFLSSAHLPQLVTSDDVALLLDQDPDEIVKDLAAIASGQDFSALAVALVETPAAEERALELPPEPAGPGILAQAASGLRRITVAGGSAIAAALAWSVRILEALLPDRQEVALAPSQRRQRALMWAAIAIPVLLTLLTIAMYWNVRDNREAEFQMLLQSAIRRQATAVSPAVGPDRVRELLLAAAADLERALALRPDDAVAQRRLRQVRTQLDQVEGITRLPGLTQVASLPGAEGDRRRLIVQGDAAYVLNASQEAMYHIRLADGKITRILHSGETRAGVTVGQLIDMAWVPAGGVREQGAIIALDSAGHGWAIDGTGNIVRVTINLAEPWQDPRLVGGYAGNFYVLDAGVNQIFKYPSTIDGYTEPATHWLRLDAGVRLQDAVDMAIDGAIYVAKADGRIEKLVAGKPEPFDQPDELDFGRPVVLFASPPPEFVYLADQRRILQLGSDGAFQRQLLPPEGFFRHLSAVWIDESGSRLYAVDAGALITAPLP